MVIVTVIAIVALSMFTIYQCCHYDLYYADAFQFASSVGQGGGLDWTLASHKFIVRAG